MPNVNLTALGPRIITGRVPNSVTFLLTKRPVLPRYDYIEDLVVDQDYAPTTDFSGFIHHFSQVRQAILRILWRNGVLIGPTVIDNLLYSALKDPTVASPVLKVLSVIEDVGLHRPGFVLYPIHSFGIAGWGLLGFITGRRLNFIDKISGIALTPQVNNEDELVKFLKAATTKLKMKRKIAIADISNHETRGILKWLLYNPLLLVKCRTFSQEYFENQFLLVIKLKLATTLVSMLYSMQKKSNANRVYSTSAINNFPTLDIRHYLVFQVNPKKQSTFDVRRIPMNLRSAELAELSELNIQLNLLAWKRSALAERLSKAIMKFERSYMENCVGIDQVTPTIKVYRKIYLALEYFRRSFRSSSKVEDQIVTLATAFEILLIDSSRSQMNSITDALKILLKGIRGGPVMVSAARRLYKLRNQSVHAGKCSGEPNWRRCRLAFIHAFLVIFGKLTKMGTMGTTSTPMQDVIRS
jgi:hypothetical protein